MNAPQKALQVAPRSKDFVHPILRLPTFSVPISETDAMPDLDRPVPYDECRTERGASQCACGHYILDWQ